MALKDIYFKAEDRYYGFLDWIDARGIPIYSLVDAFEDRGVPTFPIALIVLIAIIAGLGFLAYGIVAPGTSSVMLSVSSGGDAVANADVIITLPNGIVQTGNTTDEGKFLAKLPIGQEVGIKITKANYEDRALRFTAKTGSESLPVVLELLRKTLSRTIQLLQKGTTELVKEEVAIQFSCSNVQEYSETKTTSNGIIELGGIPGDCGILYAAPKNGFSAEQDAIELETSGATVSVYLSEEIAGKGAISVYVANEAQQAVAGVEVNLKDESGLQIAKKITGSSGSAVFSEIPAGKYYFTTYDASGKYAEHDGRAEINELLPDVVLQKNIALFTKAVGKIMLLLKDSATNAPVSNAAVKLIKDGAEVASRPSAIDGKVEFNVAENVSYEIAIDHPAYMLKTLTKVQKSAAYVDVLLSSATSANANSLKVKVVDELGLPVEDAKVRLRKASDDSIIGSELSTGINGEVAFERLEPDNYYAEVLKTGFGSAKSDVAAVVAREENSVVVRLPIGTGTFEVSVLDNEQKPLAAAKVEVYNAYTNARLSENTTDLQGRKAVDARIDRKIYFVASATGYLKHTTIAYLPIRDVTQKIEIALAKDISRLEVKVLGIFATEDLEVADSLSPGQKYVAKLQLLIPANSNFDEAGVHIRTGSDDALIMEKDPIYLANVYASTSGITKGSSYTPMNNYATDALHLTTGSAKWSNIVWKNASDGVYDAEAEIVVKDGIAIGTLTELQYRGWGKKGAYVRFPTDSTLGSSENSGSKQALYAQTNSLPLSIGPSNLCDDVFCYRLIVEDIASGNLQTSIVDSYSAKVSNDYKLIFTVTSKSSTTFAGSRLKIYNETGGLGFSGYEITTVTGAKIPGTLTGASLEIDVGDVSTNSKFYGNLGIRTIKEGSTQLRLELISGNEKVMQKSVAINIAGAKGLSIEILPKIIVPFVQNNLLVRVTDSNDASALADAVVTILKDGTTLASGTTDFNGIFAYALASVSSGASLEFRAEKSNYKQNSISVSVSEDILQVSPEKISETLTIAGSDRKDVELVLNNITELPLKISSISASGDLDGLAAITFADTYEESALPKGEDFNIGVILDLTDEGKRVDEITRLSGSINISLESSEATSTWSMSVPVEITIGFGAEADESSCLVINPDTWDLFASTGSKSLSIALQNNCEVSGEGIVLREFSVKITQANDNALGTFGLSSDIEDSSDVSLTNTYSEIAPLIEAGASATLKLEFEPEDITSGEATYNIIFKAINKTTRGDEEISTQLKINAKVNDLQECVEIIQSAALAIESCPYNLGYGAYGGSGGGYGGGYGYGGAYGGYGGGAGYGGMGGYPGSTYNPYQQWGSTPTQQPWLGNYNQLYANNYPNSNYQQQFYGSDYGTGGFGGVSGGIGSYGASFNCGKTSFTVRNNCSSAVEISLSSDPALIVDKATTELSAGEELESEVQAAYMVGNYPIDVKARVADSKEASTTITTLMVNVSNIFTKTWFDCIQLDKKKFQFNNFIGKPVSGKVFNDCYDSGVRLIYSADSIKISEGSMYTTVPAATSTEPGKAPAPEQLRLSKEVTVTAIYTEGAGDHTREILQFEIIKDVQYRGGGANLTSSNPIQQIGNLRYALTAGYYTVESRATMSVEFVTRYGTRERIPFNVVLEDLWLFPGTLPQEQLYGNQEPNFKVEQCIKRDALELRRLVGNGYTDGCIPVSEEGLFSGGIFTHPPQGALPNIAGFIPLYIPLYAPNNSENWVMRISPKLCGETDKIELKESTIKQQGVVVSLRTIQNGHDIEVTVDARNLPDNEKAEIVKSIEIVASRPSKGEYKSISLPFTLCVKGRHVESSINIPPADIGLKCEKGRTGTEAYDGYGFKNLKYEWDWDKIAKDECEKKGGAGADFTVCDATQFSIALNKKANEIKKLYDKITETNSGSGAFLAEDSALTKGIGDFNNNSDELFRFVKKQAKIPAAKEIGKDFEGEGFVFFVASDSNLVESGDIEKEIASLGEIKPQKLNYGSMPGNISAVNAKLASAKNELKKLGRDEDNIFVEIPADGLGLSDEEKRALLRLGAIGSETPKIKNENYVIWANIADAGWELTVGEGITFIASEIIPVPADDTSGEIRVVLFKVKGDDDTVIKLTNKSKSATVNVNGNDFRFELLDYRISDSNPFVSVKISSTAISPSKNRATYRNAEQKNRYDGIAGKYVLPFSRYAELYKRLAEASKTVCEDQITKSCCISSNDYCYIARIDPPPKAWYLTVGGDMTKITTALLEKLHKNIDFKAGVRNKDVLDANESKAAIEKGSDDKEIMGAVKKEDGTEITFSEFYRENISFSSYLMHDAYTKDFKEDFSGTYGTSRLRPNASNQFVAKFAAWDIVDSAGEPLAVKTPDLYPVKINYDFSNADDIKFKVSVDTAKPVAGKDGGLGANPKKNFFFYMPVDGLVGSTSGNKLDREGYGTTWKFANDSAKNANMALHEPDDSGSGSIKILENAGANKGAESFVASANNLYRQMRNGAVLEIDRSGEGSYKLSPSTAVALNLTIDNMTSNLTRGTGIFYELASSNPAETKNTALKEGVIDTAGHEQIFDWRIKSLIEGTSKDFSGIARRAGEPVPEKYTSEGIVCPGGTNQYHALVWEKPAFMGTMDLRAVAYLPANHQYSIIIFCGADKTTFNSIPKIWPRTKEETPQEIVISTGSYAAKEFSLSEIFRKLNTGQFCIDTAPEKITFFWNADKVAGEAVHSH